MRTPSSWSANSWSRVPSSDSGSGEGTWRRHLLHRHDPHADGGRLGRQRGKYYIGNGNVAGRLSVFGKFADTDEYVFFLVDTQAPQYELKKNVVESQMFVAAFDLHDYPVTKADILHTGKGSLGRGAGHGQRRQGQPRLGEHRHLRTRLYEAVTHADHRVLYGSKTTFPHVRRMFADAYARLLAMKLFAARSADYFRQASDDDRRFLLFNPITKMKVTSEGERVIDLLWK